MKQITPTFRPKQIVNLKTDPNKNPWIVKAIILSLNQKDEWYIEAYLCTQNTIIAEFKEFELQTAQEEKLPPGFLNLH